MDVNDVMHRKRPRRILMIWEKSVSWVSALTFGVRWGLAAGAARGGGGGGGGGCRRKSRHRKIVPLSSLCWKTFKLKGNKKFRIWTKKS